VRYRCIDPNGKGCTFTTLVDDRIGKNGWKPPVCRSARCINRPGQETPMIPDDAFYCERNGSKLGNAKIRDTSWYGKKLEKRQRTPKTSRKVDTTDFYFPKGTILVCKDCGGRKTTVRKTPKSRSHKECRQKTHKGEYRQGGRRRLDALIERFQHESERCIAP